jgi:hypothetical protein
MNSKKQLRSHYYYRDASVAGCAFPTTDGPADAWGAGAFRSNGERIYFAGTSESGTAITYTGGPASNGWMMGGGGSLACASCHGTDGRGENIAWA